MADMLSATVLISSDLNSYLLSWVVEELELLSHLYKYNLLLQKLNLKRSNINVLLYPIMPSLPACISSVQTLPQIPAWFLFSPESSGLTGSGLKTLRSLQGFPGGCGVSLYLLVSPVSH